MNLNDFLEHLNHQKPITGNSELHHYMHEVSQNALRITAEINGSYHTPEEIRILMEELTGAPIDQSFALFPPFHTDCGKNIRLGRRVFINAGCSFQDQGGITIGDDTLIGHRVILATLNHGLRPEHRSNLEPAPITIGQNVWIGAGSIILPGVTIGDNTIIAAGATVTKDIPPNVIAAGTPAKILKQIPPAEAPAPS